MISVIEFRNAIIRLRCKRCSFTLILKEAHLLDGLKKCPTCGVEWFKDGECERIREKLIFLLSLEPDFSYMLAFDVEKQIWFRLSELSKTLLFCLRCDSEFHIRTEHLLQTVVNAQEACPVCGSLMCGLKKAAEALDSLNSLLIRCGKVEVSLFVQGKTAID